MDRRTFLSRVILSGATAFSSTLRPLQAANTDPCLILIDGITPNTSPSGLFSFLDPIISQNVPVGLAVRLDHKTSGEPDANTELAHVLSELITDYPGLVEVMLDLPDLAFQNTYQRMRSVSTARYRLKQFLAAGSATKAQFAAPQTVVARLPSDQAPTMGGLRSAKILNSILLPETPEQVEIWRNSDGTQQINGGRRLPRSPTVKDIRAAISEATSHQGPVVFATSFPGDLLNSEEELFDQGAILGDGLRQNLTPSRNYLMLPSELRFRSGAHISRHLVLCIKGDAPDNTLKSKLTSAGLPFTVISEDFISSDATNDADQLASEIQNQHPCVLVSGQNETWQRARDLSFGAIEPNTPSHRRTRTTCVAIGDSDALSVEQGIHGGFNAVLNLSPMGDPFSGYDEHGAMRVNASLVLEEPSADTKVHTLEERISESHSPTDDVVLVINEKTFGGTGRADALVQELVGLGKSQQFNILNLGQFVEAVSTTNEQSRLTRLSRRWPAKLKTGNASSTEHAQLIDDAKLAWSYFEKLTDPETGMVPATAWLENEKIQSYNFSTMWDTGSLILAIMSAHSIGIIDDAEFSHRINAVLAGLETGKFNDLQLPKGLASTDGKAKGTDKYNASDTARLLVSLHLLDNYSKSDLGIARIVEGWDLHETIRDGVPLTVKGTRLVSSYQSNYAGYISRAFGLWGFPVASPYSVPSLGSSFDNSVHLLHDVARFGPIGTEPHLLEDVELGASDLARAASDALFAAQVEAYLTSGKPVCVSEGPINRAPWFVYQGFQIGPDQGSWTYETLDPSPRFKTKGFIRAIDMLNSKAAYLWNASRPGTYSDLLVASIRNKAKTSLLGFSPGVFSVTGQSDQEYSDINTNGIILQSIAYQLNGSKPGVVWGDQA
ncbi:DUF3131 domain-containing protein [Aliiroseovarius sp. KMU-50]|uniref:DUF3131 domain-containing protein n=1 Tax=Aliiroseovarius salicola TaxID=3009082 RepID=A0ABT4W5U6_9RHOB|nr:DUF3131 domain-containing protein [Aliiroseovarius sp. KMU-50]MDA5095764.1 DUF3131 domain-containing protein [Aliiroseovarius sp. KMU-50]